MATRKRGRALHSYYLVMFRFLLWSWYHAWRIASFNSEQGREMVMHYWSVLADEYSKDYKTKAGFAVGSQVVIKNAALSQLIGKTGQVRAALLPSVTGGQRHYVVWVDETILDRETAELMNVDIHFRGRAIFCKLEDLELVSPESGVPSVFRKAFEQSHY